MTDSQAARIEIYKAVCAELGVTPPIDALFTAIGYGFHLSPDELPLRAVWEHQDASAPLTAEQCRLALQDCLSRGWLRVLSENDLAAIASDLKAGGYLGPIYGPLPGAGCVDFTELGRAIIEKIHEVFATGEPRYYECSEVVYSESSQFFRTRERAEAALEQYRHAWDPAEISGPHPIGPWRAQWWRRFPEGYRIDIVELNQWRGRGSGVHESCSVRPKWNDAARAKLQDVLDRHNVTFGEWVLLAGMDDGRRWTRYDRPNWLKRFSKQNFGRVPSLEEFSAAMKACLNYCWLRYVDHFDLNYVRSLLEHDSAILAVPKTARLCQRGASFVFDSSGKLIPAPREVGRLAEIDFTIVGAELYRTIAADCLGPDWEDDLHVENCHYCETHVYATSEHAFHRALIEPAASGNVVRAARIEPIGPWCVYWWKRFPSGYLLEMEISAAECPQV